MTPAAGPGQAVRVRIERYQDVLPVVPVEVEGLQRRFLFDTGAGVTCVVPALAEVMRLEPWGRLTGLRMGGERVDFPQVDAPRMVLGGVVVEPRAVGVLDLSAFLPEGWPPVDGVLALDALHARPFTLDLAGRELVLESVGSLADRVEEAIELEARVGRPVHGAGCELFVRASVGDRALWLEVDSCNAAPVLLAEHTEVEFDEDGATRIELDMGHGMAWSGQALVQDLIIDGNLGQTFLAEHQLTVDLTSEHVWVRRT